MILFDSEFRILFLRIFSEGEGLILIAWWLRFDLSYDRWLVLGRGCDCGRDIDQLAL